MEGFPVGSLWKPEDIAGKLGWRPRWLRARMKSGEGGAKSFSSWPRASSVPLSPKRAQHTSPGRFPTPSDQHEQDESLVPISFSWERTRGLLFGPSKPICALEFRPTAPEKGTGRGSPPALQVFSSRISRSAEPRP